MKKRSTAKSNRSMSDEAVRAKTGKAWSEWFALLDKVGAMKMNHTEIASYLYDKKGVPSWWCQMVAVEYERARGLREKHQRPTGYEISVSKTLPVSAAKLFNAWKDQKMRSRWLPKTPIVIHKATPSKSMRVTWTDGKKSVSVNFYTKGSSKTQVVVQHGSLPDAKSAAKMKSYWSGALDRLQQAVEG